MQIFDANQPKPNSNRLRLSGVAKTLTGFQILKLEKGQNLNQHRGYNNHPDYPDHTIKFGHYMGGSLQMLRHGVWHLYDKNSVLLSCDALKVTHREKLENAVK